jgi:hypothetical protein
MIFINMSCFRCNSYWVVWIYGKFKLYPFPIKEVLSACILNKIFYCLRFGRLIKNEIIPFARMWIVENAKFPTAVEGNNNLVADN